MPPLPAFIDTISVNTANPTRPDYMVRLIVPGESCLLEGRQVIELARQLLQADAECMALDLADAEMDSRTPLERRIEEVCDVPF